MKRTVLTLVAIMMTAPAMAQGMKMFPHMCGPRDSILKQVETNYSESVYGAGLMGNSVVEIWANPGTGSFTVVHTDSDNEACVLGGGKHWIEFKKFVPGLEF